jgi:hypothetical protein
MASTIKYLQGTIATLMSTELNSLVNTQNAISSAAYDNSSNLFLMGEVEFATTSAFGTAPTANTGLSIWFLRNIDGTNYEDGATGTGITPSRMPDLVIPLENQNTTAQRITRRCIIPPGTFKVLVKNDGTGQTLPATGNTLKILPLTYQVV